MQNRTAIFLLLISVCLGACRQKNTDTEGYIRYMLNQDNGLIQEKEVDGIVFRAQWMTPEMMALKEKKQLTVNEVAFKKMVEEYGTLKYVSLSITGREDEHIHSVLVKEQIDPDNTEAYMNMDAQSDLQLVYGSDTAQCVLYSFSKTYGLAKQFSIAAAFEVKESKHTKDYTLEWNATVLNRGLLKFKFYNKDIQNIPHLNI